MRRKQTTLSKAELQQLVEHTVIGRNDIAYTHPIFMQCFMPARRLPSGTPRYEISHGKASLVIRAGELIKPGEVRSWEQQEIPSGPKARLLVAYINDQAIRTKTSTIDMGHSLREFMERNGIPVSGANGKEIVRQAKNLAAAEILLGTWGEREAHQANLRIAKGLSFWLEKDGKQRTLWTPELELSDDYLKALLAGRVPVDFRALVALQASPVAMDVYCWLSYRLARLEKPVAIPFEALHPVFGHATKELKHFKQKFPAVVAQALRFYKGAKVSATQTGLVLHPSPPAVPGKVGEGIGPRAISKAAVPLVNGAMSRRSRVLCLIEDLSAVGKSESLDKFLHLAVPALVEAGVNDQIFAVLSVAKSADTRNPPGYIRSELNRLLERKGLTL